jgi:hypothetical protein
MLAPERSAKVRRLFITNLRVGRMTLEVNTRFGRIAVAEGRSEEREARSEKRGARSEKREARSKKLGARS